MMTKYLFALCVFSALHSRGQINDAPVKLDQYVLPSFTNGTVKLKSGEVSNQLLNYNLLSKEIIFEQGGQYLAIADPGKVDTVYIGGRKFIPANKAFYELLDNAAIPLFIEHTCTVTEQGTPTGFGNTNTSAATSLKSLQNSTGAYKLKIPDQFKVVPGRNYYIQKNGQYHKVNNEQQVTKLFPDKKQIIKEWIKNNHTNFSRQEDVLLLIQQIQ